MTYLLLLRLLERPVRWAMKRCDPYSRRWTELADLDGRIVCRRIRYSHRVWQAARLERVEVGPPPATTNTRWVTEPSTTCSTGSVTYVHEWGAR